MAGTFDLRKLLSWPWRGNGGRGDTSKPRVNTAPLRQRLQYMLDHQRDVAKTLQEHLVRVWQRPLAVEEANTVLSYVVCTPTLRLEQAQMRVAHAETSEDANQFLSDMRGQLTASADATIVEIRRRFVLDEAHAPEPSACANLLAWEEKVLEGL
jgi:hypothetical protein